jgi:hypothetical protein
LPSTSALFKKPTPSSTMHCSDAGSPLSIFSRSTTQACFWMKSSLVLVGT